MAKAAIGTYARSLGATDGESLFERVTSRAHQPVDDDGSAARLALSAIDEDGLAKCDCRVDARSCHVEVLQHVGVLVIQHLDGKTLCGWQWQWQRQYSILLGWNSPARLAAAGIDIVLYVVGAQHGRVLEGAERADPDIGRDLVHVHLGCKAQPLVLNRRAGFIDLHVPRIC